MEKVNWYKINEILAPKCSKILVYSKGEGVQIAHSNDKGRPFSDIYSHWARLPEGPEEV